MEFPFDLNYLFENEITCIDKSLLPKRTFHANVSEYRQQLCKVIDKMGEASAKAQTTPGPMTSTNKLSSTDNRCYIMIDKAANSGHGAVIGLLKVGHKNLFVYDNHNGIHEADAFCILDFYVHESRQRMGCGKKLFEAMLLAENIQPRHMAVDRPSPKSLNFLQKHYGLKTTIPQVNNFVIFEGFFKDNKIALDRRKRGSSHANKPPRHPYSRQENSNLDGRPSSGRPLSGNTALQAQMERDKNAAAGWCGFNCGSLQKKFSTSLNIIADADTCHHDTMEKKEALSHIGVVRSGSRNSLQSDGSRPSSQQHMQPLEADRTTIAQGMGARDNQYSRHSPMLRVATLPNPPSSQIENHQQLSLGTKILRAPVGPQMGLRRDGPSEDYVKLLQRELAQPSAYQDRRGHLLVSPLNTAGQVRTPGGAHRVQTQIGAGGASGADPCMVKHDKVQNLDSTWKIFGIPPNPKSMSSPEGRRYGNARLW